MRITRTRLGSLVGLAAFVLATIVAGSAHAQLGGFGGFGGGGLGGGGLGGGGLGGGGQGGFFTQGAGVVVDADGVLRMKTWRDPNGVLHRQRFNAAKAALNPELSKPSDLRKVSLRRLERAVAKQLEAGQDLTEDMKYLAGMLRIQYVFFYPETNDIVIAGPAEGFAPDLSGRVRGLTSGRAILELQDLIVAMRAFPPGGNATRVVGCSIDPTEEGLQRMQNLLGNVGRLTPGDAGRLAEAMRQSLGLQEVTIEGVPTNTHFAQVLVEADYRMKLIGIGLEQPPVNLKSYVERANPRDVARNALLRWYFTPNYEAVRVSDDELAMELVGWGVKLVGADEVVRGDGVRVEGARADLASKAWCQQFTEVYPLLADRSPVYAQLRNLIDMTIAAAFMQQHDYYGKAGWDLGLFGDESKLPVETYETPKTVESAVNVVWKGNTLMTPIGGGVEIQPTRALDSANLLADEGSKVKETRYQTKRDNLADDQWWWD